MSKKAGCEKKTRKTQQNPKSKDKNTSSQTPPLGFPQAKWVKEKDRNITSKDFALENEGQGKESLEGKNSKNLIQKKRADIS